MNMFFYKIVNICIFIVCSNLVIAQTHEKIHIEWNISLTKIEGHNSKYLLTNEYSINHDSEEFLCVLPKMKTLPVSAGLYTIDSTLLSKVHILDFYLTKFTSTQYLIENDIGDFETFSFNTKMPRTANYIIRSQYGLQESYNSDCFNLTSDRVIAIGEEIDLKQLKLIEGKEKIRLHYLFKGESCNIEPFTLTSNWITLPL